jgi:hypothetical protein
MRGGETRKGEGRKGGEGKGGEGGTGLRREGREGGRGSREGKEGERRREGKGLKPPKVNFLVTSLYCQCIWWRNVLLNLGARRQLVNCKHNINIYVSFNIRPRHDIDAIEQSDGITGPYRRGRTADQRQRE